jgi:hypothetical protein
MTTFEPFHSQNEKKKLARQKIRQVVTSQTAHGPNGFALFSRFFADYRPFSGLGLNIIVSIFSATTCGDIRVSWEEQG